MKLLFQQCIVIITTVILSVNLLFQQFSICFFVKIAQIISCFLFLPVEQNFCNAKINMLCQKNAKNTLTAGAFMLLYK